MNIKKNYGINVDITRNKIFLILDKQVYKTNELFHKGRQIQYNVCSDIFKEARERYIELEDELHTSDAALMDALHSIELETPKDLYSACDIYKPIRYI